MLTGSTAYAAEPCDFQNKMVDRYAESIGVHHAWQWQYEDTVRLFKDIYKETGVKFACCDSCGNPWRTKRLHHRNIKGQTYRTCPYCSKHVPSKALRDIKPYKPIKYGKRTHSNKLHKAAVYANGTHSKTGIKRALTAEFPELSFR